MTIEKNINQIWYEICIELGLIYKKETHWENREQLDYNKQFIQDWRKNNVK